MKTGKYTIGLLLLCCISACGPSRKEQLCHDWKVYRVDFENVNKDTVGKDPLQDGMEEAFKQIMSNMISNTVYHFHEDGSYVVRDEKNERKGEWKLAEGGKELLMKANSGNANEESKPALIEHLDDSSMVLLMRSDQSSYDIRLRLSLVPSEGH